MTPTRYKYDRITIDHPEIDLFLIKIDGNQNNINTSIIPVPQVVDIAKYKNYADRRKRLLTRSFLYEFLAERYGISDFSLASNEFKKPFLPAAPGINFSFSYSKDYALIGILNGQRLGVDIEFIDPYLDVDELAGQIMCGEELEYFYSCGDNAVLKRIFFFKLFSLKESIVKSFGMGLHFPVRNLNILNGDSFVFEGASFSCTTIDAPITGFSLTICYENNRQNLDRSL